MCPVCLTTAALVAAGATSTGGLTALVARTIHRRRAATPARPDALGEREEPTDKRPV